jgi:hypothetical protein
MGRQDLHAGRRQEAVDAFTASMPPDTTAAILLKNASPASGATPGRLTLTGNIISEKDDEEE